MPIVDQTEGDIEGVVWEDTVCFCEKPAGQGIVAEATTSSASQATAAEATISSACQPLPLPEDVFIASRFAKHILVGNLRG